MQDKTRTFCLSLTICPDRTIIRLFQSVGLSFYRATIVSKICVLANLVNAGNANTVTITPLIAELTASITGATTSLGALPPSRRHLKRDAVSQVALVLASLITVSDRRIWLMSTDVCPGCSDHS